ncbi:MAG: GNAT family N-acetyltransferase [Bacteroidetes bacterium GWA2_31_9]|nr:MAG: GNAT family N-acetyltransferase [Bacteroidetes bacterium GWA2_31_9]
MLEIRKAISSDADEIWKILHAIICKADSFAYSPSSTKEEMLSYWMSANKHTYTALIENKIVGTLFIQDNQPGLGSHIANAAYATSPTIYGKGIGKQMGLFSLLEAKKMGYYAIQFNIVVKSNERAVKLWQDIGFNIIGEIPEAFRHKTLGFVNAYIMYQKL